MLKTIIAGAALVVVAYIPPASAGPKGDALRACQVAWKDHKAQSSYVPAPKGQGRQAYWTFVRECKSKKAT